MSVISPEAAALSHSAHIVTKNFTHHPLILVRVQVAPAILLLPRVTVTELRVIRASGSSPTFIRHFAANRVKLCSSQTFSVLTARSPHPINTPTVARRHPGPLLLPLSTGLTPLIPRSWPGRARLCRGSLHQSPLCYGILGNNARSSWRILSEKETRVSTSLLSYILKTSNDF